MEDLRSYLNDHLAGSVVALELLDRLIKIYEGNSLERFFGELRDDIEVDQKALKDLIASLGESESPLRKTAAWVMEKVSRARIHLDEKREEKAGLFLALEALALGLTGKRALWRALATASETALHLRGPNYAKLEERAIEQHARVETKRLEAASEVFNRESEK